MKGQPNPVLGALFAAQKEAASIPATTSRTTRDGAKIVESTYAGSEDVLRTARGVLLRHDLMATLLSTTIDERRVMTLVVELLHVTSGRRLRRTYAVEVGEFGSSAATVSGFTTALRLLLLLPREPEQVRVRAPEGLEPPPDLDDGPRATQRVVIPAPVLPVVQDNVDRAELEHGCQRLVMELRRLRGGAIDHAALKSAAGVPIRGPMTTPELRKYSHYLAELVRHEPEPPQAEPDAPDPPPIEPPQEEEHGEG